MATDIKVLISPDIRAALTGASSPSASNVFLTASSGGTIKGSIAATAGLIPYGTGVADTVTYNAGFYFNTTTGLHVTGSSGSPVLGIFREWTANSGYFAQYLGVAAGSEANGNFSIMGNGSTSILNASSSIFIGIGGASSNATFLSSSNRFGQATGFRQGGAFVAPTATVTIAAADGTGVGAGQFNISTHNNALATPAAGTMENINNVLSFTSTSERRMFNIASNTRVSTQYDNATTTLGNITGLTANVVAGEIYDFEAHLFTTSNVAGGVKVAIAGTATATSVVYETLSINSGTITQSRATALATASGAVTAVTNAYIIIKGTIVVNAGGTLTAQFAANVAVGTSSVLINSTFQVKQII